MSKLRNRRTLAALAIVATGAGAAVAAFAGAAGEACACEDRVPPDMVARGGELWVSDEAGVGSVKPDSRTDGIAREPGVPAGARLASSGLARSPVWAVASGRLWRVGDEGPTKSVRLTELRSPSTVAATARSVWVGNVFGSTITRVDPQTLRPVMSLSVQQNITAMTIAGRYLWVTSAGPMTTHGGVVSPRGRGFVTRIQRDGKRIVGVPTKVGRRPTAIAGTYQRIVVGNYDDRTIDILDAATGRHVGGASTRRIRPRAVVAHGNWAWVAGEGTRSVLQVQLAPVVVRKSIEVGGQPTALAIADGSVWVATADGRVRRVTALAR